MHSAKPCAARATNRPRWRCSAPEPADRGLDTALASSDWLPAAAQRLGFTRLHAGTAGAVGNSVGGYHPSLGARLQVIGEAAEAARTRLPSPWQHWPEALVLADGVDANPWLLLARERALSLYRSPQPFHTTLWALRAAMAQAAPTTTLHGDLLEVLGLGVLLSGISGAGKSELALELIARGHRLVADDVVEVSQPAPGCLLGRSPSPLAGFIEVRGLGILDVRASYGEQAMASAVRVDLCLHLDPADTPPAAEERLLGKRDTLRLFDVELPRILLPSRLRHNAAMVEAACRDHWLRRAGYTAAQVLIDTQSRLAAGE